MNSGLLPGQITGKTSVSRDCLLSLNNVIYGRGGFDATKAYNGIDTGYESRIWAGTPLGQITASELWVACKQTAVTSSGGATSANVPVLDARAFRAGDVVTIGSNAGCTISSVNYGTNTLTVSSSITFSN